METTFGECTDNEKKETLISDCSEMRTEATSRPSVGLVGTARQSSPGFYSWGHELAMAEWRCCTKKHVFGVILATWKRNRKSQPAHRYLFRGGPARRI